MGTKSTAFEKSCWAEIEDEDERHKELYSGEGAVSNPKLALEQDITSLFEQKPATCYNFLNYVWSLYNKIA